MWLVEPSRKFRTLLRKSPRGARPEAGDAGRAWGCWAAAQSALQALAQDVVCPLNLLTAPRSPSRRCTRWYLPLLLLPLPTAPPYFLLLFLVSITIHAKPWCVQRSLAVPC